MRSSHVSLSSVARIRDLQTLLRRSRPSRRASGTSTSSTKPAQISVPRDRGPSVLTVGAVGSRVHRAQGLFTRSCGWGSTATRMARGDSALAHPNEKPDEGPVLGCSALSLDGRIGRTRNQANAPLRASAHLSRVSIRDAHRRASTATPGGVGETAAEGRVELPMVSWTSRSHVYGLPRRTLPTRTSAAMEHLIVSPFLSVAGIKHVAGGKKGTHRRLAPGRIEQPQRAGSTRRHRLRALAKRRNSGRGRREEPRGTILNDLHAKIYAVERNRRSHVFIGSANATGNAFSANVEILAERLLRPRPGVFRRYSGNSGFGSILQKTEIAPARQRTTRAEGTRSVRPLGRRRAPDRDADAFTDGVATMVVASKLELPTVAAGALSLSPLTVPAKNAALTRVDDLGRFRRAPSWWT